METKICGAFTCSNPLPTEGWQRVYVRPATNAPGSKQARAEFDLCHNCILKYRNDGGLNKERVTWIEENLKIEMLPPQSISGFELELRKLRIKNGGRA